MNAPANTIPDGRRRVLIVDDVEDNRVILERYLAGIGFATQSCADGRQAIAAITLSKPDIVLLDWMMPELSGLETLAAIREIYDSARLPVIMCTALEEEVSVVSAFNAGANDYITKPITFGVLKARIAAHLKQCAIVAEGDRARVSAEKRLDDQMRSLFDRRFDGETRGTNGRASGG